MQPGYQLMDQHCYVCGEVLDANQAPIFPDESDLDGVKFCLPCLKSLCLYLHVIDIKRKHRLKKPDRPPLFFWIYEILARLPDLPDE